MNPALVYGEIKYFCGPGTIGSVPEKKLLAMVSTFLAPFKPVDFLVLLGDPELLAVTFSIACQISSVVQLLKYDRIQENYKIRKYEQRIIP